MQYTFISLSERTIIIRLNHFTSDQHHNIQTLFNLCENLTKHTPWIVECIPTLTGVTVCYDLNVIQQICHHPQLPSQFAKDYLKRHLTDTAASSVPITDIITIPVCYEYDYAPDLKAIAQHTGLSEGEVIHIHSTGVYRVDMMGFSPGFPYLSGMSERLATPRLKSPRLSVPAGSVGIADEQTGIYSLDTPGGWHLLGRTPLPLFTPHNETPSLLKSGQRIIFQPITHQEFSRLYRKHRS